MPDIYADFRWICCRIILHGLCIFPIVSVWYVLTKSLIFTSAIVLFLGFIYLTLAYAQIKTPLLKLCEPNIEFNNFFYKGNNKFLLNDILNVSFKSKKIVFYFENEKLVINFLGMSLKKCKKSIESVEKMVKSRGMSAS